MNNAFISGFIKAAHTCGFSTDEALELIKNAGRGALMKAFINGAQTLHKQIPGISKAAPKAYEKVIDTADTLQGMVAGSGVAARGTAAATQQGDMARLLRDRVRALKPAAPNVVPASNPLIPVR